MPGKVPPSRKITNHIAAEASVVLFCFFICKACWISAFLPEPSWPPVDHRGITIMKGTADHSWRATWADVDNLSTNIEDGSTTRLRLNWLYLSPAQRLFKATLNLHQRGAHTQFFQKTITFFFIFSLLKKLSFAVYFLHVTLKYTE